MEAQAPSPIPEQAPEPPPSRDAAYWAPHVKRLAVGELPADARNANVHGRRVMSPVQGFGKMWQKTYRVALDGATETPTQVIATWKAHFPEFWPGGNRFFGPLTGIAPGEVGVLNLRAPGGMKLSTGVFVLYSDDEAFTFMTPQGHMFAGWITFSAAEVEGGTVAQVQVLMRANDPIMEVGLTLGGHRQENVFWQQTLTNLATRFGVSEPVVTTDVVCVDKRRQWRHAGNVWHDIGIRSMLYPLGAPVRLVKSRRRK